MTARWLRAALTAAALAWLALLPSAALAQQPTILVTRIDGAITPVVADHLTDGVDRAEAEGHAAYLVELETPGGLDTSMREIVQRFLSARVPVIVYVTPPGARAASAGTFITMSAHVAAMAPGTTIGAATPVDLQGGEISDKVINDAASFAEAVASERGRSVEFAVDAVRDGRSATAEEAERIGAVDLVAADRAALLEAIDGREVEVEGGTVTLRTEGAGLVEDDLGLARELLQILADPNLAFLFLSIGGLAIIYELAVPGVGLGGVIGALMLIMGFYALSVLPVNIAGIALLVLAAALFIGELFVPGVGALAAGGAIALVFAGVFLFEGSIDVSPVVLWPVALVMAGGSLVAGRLALRARKGSVATGQESMIGRELRVLEASGTRGQGRLDGTWWNLHSPEAPLHPGDTVRITGLEGLDLVVEPVDSTEGEP